MRGVIPPLPQYAFMAWCLVKLRDNFTFISFYDFLGPFELRQFLVIMRGYVHRRIYFPRMMDIGSRLSLFLLSISGVITPDLLLCVCYCTWIERSPQFFRGNSTRFPNVDH
jgi:hypothetical protein